MKILNRVGIDPNHFEIINDRRCPRQLYRVNNYNQYVLALLDGRDRIFQFESEVFTALLNDLVTGVRDVTLVEPKEAEFGTHSEIGFEIRLYLENDDVIGINQNDDVRFYISGSYKEYIAELSVVPVLKLWDLPPDYPFNFLDMSLGLKKRLDSHITSSSPAEVITRMFSDYKRSVDIRNGDVRGNATFVEGEFLNFTVVESTDRRVLMHHVQ